jgi:hypothetical protein
MTATPYDSHGREIQPRGFSHPRADMMRGYEKLLAVGGLWAHAKLGSEFVTPHTHDLVMVQYATPEGKKSIYWTCWPKGWDAEAKPAPAADWEPVRVDHRPAITAAVIAAVKAGNAILKDSGTDAVDETTLYGGGRKIAVFPHWAFRPNGSAIPGVGHPLTTPAEAQSFIGIAAANCCGVEMA